MGSLLAPLRERGVLIVGSGALTHNFGEFVEGARPGVPEGWVREFEVGTGTWCVWWGRGGEGAFSLGAVGARVVNPNPPSLPFPHTPPPYLSACVPVGMQVCVCIC
jgi:hypothetical protein